MDKKLLGRRTAAVVLSLSACMLVEGADTLKVESTTAFAGNPALQVRILADNGSPVEAIACTGQYAVGLTLTDAGILGTELGPGNLAAEWFDWKQVGADKFAVASIIDFTTPYAGRILAAGTNHHVFDLSFAVAGGLPAGRVLPITLLPEVGTPPVLALFTVAGATVIPALASGQVTIVAAPVVTGVAPQRGPLAGGTTITITGGNFTGDTAVTVGGAALGSLVVVNATTITGMTPAHAAGAVDVTASNALGTDTLEGAFTYVAPPVVTAVDPSIGHGAVDVVITGQNFTDSSDTKVTFGATAVTDITSVTPTSIACRLPVCTGATGWVAISVTTSGGTATLEQGYRCVLTFRRGDANCDNARQIADAIAMLGYLFSGQQVLCLDALDSNDDGRADLSDAVFMVRHLFGGGAPPPSPFPDLGIDPTDDGLGCEAQCGS